MSAAFTHEKKHTQCIKIEAYESYVLFIKKIITQIINDDITIKTQISIVDKILFLSLVKELTNEYHRKNIITEVAKALTDIKEDIIKITPLYDFNEIDIKKLISIITKTEYTIHELLCYIQTIINMYSNSAL